MRTFETTSMFDFENQEWVELYYIDGEEVDCETYFEEMEYEVYGDEDEDEYFGEYGEYVCECECKDDSDETQEEIKLIEGFASGFENSGCTCGACLRNTLYSIYQLGKQIGFTDCKDVFRNVVEYLDK
jgi:hypothetical protein